MTNPFLPSVPNIHALLTDTCSVTCGVLLEGQMIGKSWLSEVVGVNLSFVKLGFMWVGVLGILGKNELGAFSFIICV